MSKSRPASVLVIAILNFIVGAFTILAGVWMMLAVSTTLSMFDEWSPDASFEAVVAPKGMVLLAGLLSVAVLAAGVLVVSAGVGLLRLRRWGRRLGIAGGALLAIGLAMAAGGWLYFVTHSTGGSGSTGPDLTAWEYLAVLWEAGFAAFVPAAAATAALVLYGLLLVGLMFLPGVRKSVS